VRAANVPWSAALGVVGLLVSGYLVVTHYFAESMLGPVPVAVLGVAWFGVYLALLAARARQPRDSWRTALVGWSSSGLLFVFYLVYAELFLVGAICLWCTVVHAIVVVLFLRSLWEATTPEVSPRALA
jgi:uncharacterized membrane protein